MKKYAYYIFALIVVSLPHTVAAIPPPRNPGLPSGWGENPILGVISDITDFVASIIAVLAILMIVISGIMYMTSGGDQTRVDTAKNWLTYAVIGLVVALLAFVIVRAVGGALGAWYI